MIAFVLFLRYCTITMRGSSFHFNFSWALHTKTPRHVFLMRFDFKCSFEGFLLWRCSRIAASAHILSTPRSAECRLLFPDFSLSLVFRYSLRALIPTPVSSWLREMVWPQPKIDLVWQWWSIMLNYWSGLWLGLLPIWPSLVVSRVILHSKIIDTVIYYRTKKSYHQRNLLICIHSVLMQELCEQFIFRVCSSAAESV